MEEENQEIYGSHNKLVYLNCQSLQQGCAFDDPIMMENIGHSSCVDKYTAEITVTTATHWAHYNK